MLDALHKSCEAAHTLCGRSNARCVHACDVDVGAPVPGAGHEVRGEAVHERHTVLLHRVRVAAPAQRRQPDRQAEAVQYVRLPQTLELHSK